MSIVLRVQEEVALRKKMVEIFRATLKGYIGQSVSVDLLDEMTEVLYDKLLAVVSRGQFGREAAFVPRIVFRRDPADPSAVQAIPTNDSALWLVALSGEEPR
jgi:hypothetical protein